MKRTGRLILKASEVHLWRLPTDQLQTLVAPTQFLTAAEKMKLNTFVSKTAASEYLGARTAIRLLLSLYYPQRGTNEWKFDANPYGKPHIGNPIENVEFNLSHSGQSVVCALSLHRALGIDIEQVRRPPNLLDFARDSFSPSEVMELATHPQDNQINRFFEYWTLKESYIKARGMGLSLPLDQFSFRIRQPEIRISFEPRIQDDPNHWRFWLSKRDGLQLALAVQCAPNEKVTLVDQGNVPLPLPAFKAAG